MGLRDVVGAGTRYVDCKSTNIPGSLKGMREIFDGWLELARDGRCFLVFDDLHCIAKTEVEVSLALFASRKSHSRTDRHV